MKYPTTAPQPPGWYLDPNDRNQQRWFDGAGWSHHVRATTDEISPVVRDDGRTAGPQRRPGRKRTVAAVPAGLAVVVIALKLALLVTNLIDDAHPHADAPAVVQQPVPPAAGEQAPAPAVQAPAVPFRRAELEQEIVAGLVAGLGPTVTATCPDTATVIAGMEFLCTVTADGTWGSADVVVGPAGTWTWTYLPEASSIPPR